MARSIIYKILTISLVTVFFCGIGSCGKTEKQQLSEPEVATTSVSSPEKSELSGVELAQRYCSGCHALPQPDLLDRKTWEKYILNRMGNYYGIYETPETRSGIIEGGRAGQFVERANLFPNRITLDTLLFQKIKSFYLENAPETLNRPDRDEIKIGLSQFSVRKPTYRANSPMTSLVKIAAPNKLYVSDVGRSSLSVMDKNFTIGRNAPAREGVSWIYEKGSESMALVMGTFNPTDMNIGYLMTLPQVRGGDARILVQDLQRPVHFDVGDLDGDGQQEIVICEYGKHTGSLSLWKKDQAGSYRKKVLRAQPGATKAYLVDWSGNGRKDIVALFGQGDEGIFVYHNQGNGNFVEEKVITFPPSYGSSYFELVDMNGDGHLDILYTAGDNADYDPILKGYHGIRIFQNDGTNHFTETYFYPLNGAYKAMSVDFDGDGDLDIAAISFFPDYKGRPEESFVYLENNGKGEYSASTFPDAAQGRWIAMDVGDVDGDGDMDIILGSMVFGTDFSDYFDRWAKNGVPYLLLENAKY